MMEGLEKHILISGAGPIGLSFALGLHKSPLSITIVDQHKRPTTELLEQDTRMIALSHRSVKFLESIDLWQGLKPYATSIESVHVSEKGYATKVELYASDHHLENFGALIPLGRLVLGMHEALEACENIQYLDETRLIDYQIDEQANSIKAQTSLQMSNGKVERQFDWIIAAEGVHSHLRMLSGIESYHTDYDQIAIIARARFSQPHRNMAYERFTSDGPLALLPIGSHEMAVVLIADRADKEMWESASNERFADEIIYRIGYELGDVEAVTDRHIWDLSLMVPKTVCKPCLTLIGNSAHSLHPIAGQGLNLGFRDCEILLPYFQAGNIPTVEGLKPYQKERRKDVLKVVGATDFLVRGFGLDLPFAPHLRNIALRLVSHLPPLKKRIARFGMGY